MGESLNLPGDGVVELPLVVGVEEAVSDPTAGGDNVVDLVNELKGSVDAVLGGLPAHSEGFGRARNVVGEDVAAVSRRRAKQARLCA